MKQRYGTELRSRTLATIKPEVSQALDSLLEELHHTEEARVMRSAGQFPNQPYTQFQKPQSFQRNIPHRSSKGTCPICKQAGRKVFDHFLSTCSYLPESDRHFLTRARLIATLDEDNQPVYNQACDDSFEELSDSHPPTM